MFSSRLFRKYAAWASSVILSCVAVIGCESTTDRGSEELIGSGALPSGYTTGSLRNLEDYLAENDLPSGNWLNENGARVCDGYMTRFADQEYCAAEIPEDWVPFTFDGQEYYIQPLADSEDLN
jgi:hypothetical protein